MTQIVISEPWAYLFLIGAIWGLIDMIGTLAMWVKMLFRN